VALPQGFERCRQRRRAALHGRRRRCSRVGPRSGARRVADAERGQRVGDGAAGVGPFGDGRRSAPAAVG
jgi:hypothetical protein